jgi:hypothetical protein
MITRGENRRLAIAIKWNNEMVFIPLFDFGPGCAV